MVKDLEPELLRHLAQGTASLLISTKGSPRGELRGQVRGQHGLWGRAKVGPLWSSPFAVSEPWGSSGYQFAWMQKGYTRLSMGSLQPTTLSLVAGLMVAARSTLPECPQSSRGRDVAWGLFELSGGDFAASVDQLLLPGAHCQPVRGGRPTSCCSWGRGDTDAWGSKCSTCCIASTSTGACSRGPSACQTWWSRAAQRPQHVLL